MIREFRQDDMAAAMEIWIATNAKAHNFIFEEYWFGQYFVIKVCLPNMDAYVYEDDATNEILGSIFIENDFLVGICVKDEHQSKGIGKQMLDYAKGIKPHLVTKVYTKNTRAVDFFLREQFSIGEETTNIETEAQELTLRWDSLQEINTTKTGYR